MLYRIIEKKRDEWLTSDRCVVTELISYIEKQNKMRDAQIDAIKTYLYLKIECENKPLWELFANGKFNSTRIEDLDDLEIKSETRKVLSTNPSALALWEYASLKDERGIENSPKIVNAIRQRPNEIDYIQIIKDLLFNIQYTDYLFSIPMGAGKTYLMAALIYLNLYFALSEPENPIFAHNFILLVPSGLKSSIIPSLRDIQNFNPLWILPDPAATQIKNIIQYEWLQESSSASKSNIVKNPNARKISMHTADPHLIGLVAVTNAEKVILDRVDNSIDVDKSLFKHLSDEEKKEIDAAEQANELRKQIGEIPGLCILIDEVHHASENQKLRQVVNKWMGQSNFNSVLGFTGTPNMDPPLSVFVTDDLNVKCTQYANVVTYYPLIKGLGNFLKIPTVRYANLESAEILNKGLKEFFEEYAEKTYQDGTTAKIAIYAPSIQVLEDELYPEACKVCADLGMNPTETILKYHKGNQAHKVTEDAQFEFSILDTPTSTKRIILLVGIGREGWNCKSLTGVILSQRNSCPQNMVLQISCRCLREEDNAREETALIWLNKFNAEKLNTQLQQQQYTTLADFSSRKAEDSVTIQRYSRMNKIKLPPIDFYQIKINYNTVETIVVKDVSQYLRDYVPPIINETVIYSQNFDIDNIVKESEGLYDMAGVANFRLWLDLIIKESLGTLDISTLCKYEDELKCLFGRITETLDGLRIFNKSINQKEVRADIRKAFVPRRSFNVTEELIPEEASLLKIDSLTSPIEANRHAIFSPTQEKVQEIIEKDRNPAPELTADDIKYLKSLQSRGIKVEIPQVDNCEYDRTYHYLPYHLDSTLENDYLNSIISYIKSVPNVEIYFNGDDTLTDFKIRCYSKRGNAWKMLGYYYPDFIMLTRNDDNTIDKIVIVETKGEGFAAKFEPRKRFMEDMFIRLNNQRYGRERFSFLYIEDTDKPELRLQKTINKIKNFLLK